jgi:hypothetical protein
MPKMKMKDGPPAAKKRLEIQRKEGADRKIPQRGGHLLGVFVCARFFTLLESEYPMRNAKMRMRHM